MKIAAKLENDKAYGKAEITVHVHGIPKGTSASKTAVANVLKNAVSAFAPEFEKIHSSLKSSERKGEYTESFGSTYRGITLDIKCDATMRGIDGFSKNHHLIGLVVETAKQAVMEYIEKVCQPVVNERA